MTDHDLAARIALLEDRHAIMDMCSRYSLAMDDHDFDALAGLFAPDAVYGWVDQPPQAEGRAAIVELFRSRIGNSGPSFHVNHDMIIDSDAADPSRASGIIFCHAEVCPAGKQLACAIRYRDRYVKMDGKWLFAARFLSFLYFVPVEEYQGILTQIDRLRVGGSARPAHWPHFAV